MTAARYDSRIILPLFLGLVLTGLVWTGQAHGQVLVAGQTPASPVISLKVDGSTSSPSSPRQWQLDAVKLAASGQGYDLVLHSGPTDGAAPAPDLYLDFDGTAPMDAAGRWAVETIGPYAKAPGRFGDGSGTFRAPQTKLELRPRDSLLFRPDEPMGDFTIEFWLNPARADSGEIVMLWKATRRVGRSSQAQQLTALVLRNRMTFGFVNLFSDTAGREHSVSLQGTSVLVPGRWSHHLVRHDAATGLLEYLMDGKPEAVAYATSNGRQGGLLLAAISGGVGRLELAPNYTGLLDEFAFRPYFVDKPALVKYAPGGGTAVSPVYDLGTTNSQLVSISASTRIPGDSAVHWSYRIADSAVSWTDTRPEWKPFIPGQFLGAAAKGRYAQIRMTLYPDGSGEHTPVVSSVTFNYEPDLPPAPPARISATPGDGSVSIYWSPASEADVRGYMLYYGYGPGDYFGNDAVQGPSPVVIRGADTSSALLTGLTNGRLYYLAVAGFDSADPPHVGDFSREVTARPSRISP
jgi:hypothetical protein